MATADVLELSLSSGGVLLVCCVGGKADFSQSFCPSTSKNLELKGKKKCKQSQNRQFLNHPVHGKVKEKTTRLKTGKFITNPSMKRLKKKK
jgi:hypothetical protein